MDGGGGWLGSAPHTHAHARAHMHAHTCVLNMIISCKWPPPLGESLGIPYDVICACACMCMGVHMCGGTLSPPLLLNVYAILVITQLSNL